MIYDVMIGICFLLGMIATFFKMCRDKGIERFSEMWKYILSHRVDMAIWIIFAVGGLFALRYGGFELLGMPLEVINPGTAFGAGIGVAVYLRTTHKKKGAS